MTELVVGDFVELNPFPGQGPGRDGLASVLASMFAGFPDLHWSLRDTVAEGDRVVGLSTWTGTHRGEFLGIPATGRSVAVVIGAAAMAAGSTLSFVRAPHPTESARAARSADFQPKVPM